MFRCLLSLRLFSQSETTVKSFQEDKNEEENWHESSFPLVVIRCLLIRRTKRGTDIKVIVTRHSSHLFIHQESKDSASTGFGFEGNFLMS